MFQGDSGDFLSWLFFQKPKHINRLSEVEEEEGGYYGVFVELGGRRVRAVQETSPQDGGRTLVGVLGGAGPHRPLSLHLPGNTAG